MNGWGRTKKETPRTKTRNEWLSPNRKETLHTRTCAHPQKIILCIWWNSEGVLYYELLPRVVTITADIYCQQLKRLADTIQEKEPIRLRDVMLLHDNARRTLLTWEKNTIEELVRKSIRTHLIHLILRPQTFTFSALYWQNVVNSEGEYIVDV